MNPLVLITKDTNDQLRILDMCSAPGGKTMAIADYIPNAKYIIALDRSFTKLRKIEKGSVFFFFFFKYIF